ncbi:hypothetical protein D3C73_1473570 [compost metagenome]
MRPLPPSLPLLTATRPWKFHSDADRSASTRAASAAVASAETVVTTAGAGVFCRPTVVQALRARVTATSSNGRIVETLMD